MTGLGNGRSPRAGKKSVPPDRIWAPWRERVSTASSSVVGLKYKPLVPHRQSGARTADDWLSVHSHTNAASLYRSVLGRAFSPHRHRGHRGRSIGFSRLPTPVRYGVSRRASFNRNARDRPAFERFQIADHAHHSTTLCASVVRMGSCPWSNTEFPQSKPTLDSPSSRPTWPALRGAPNLPCDSEPVRRCRRSGCRSNSDLRTRTGQTWRW